MQPEQFEENLQIVLETLELNRQRTEEKRQEMRSRLLMQGGGADGGTGGFTVRRKK
jgi:hypothetical protein